MLEEKPTSRRNRASVEFDPLRSFDWCRIQELRDGAVMLATASLEVGIDALGARGDLQRHCGVSIDPIDGKVVGPLTLYGEPRNQPEWRL